jgi:hypothetical protein
MLKLAVASGTVEANCSGFKRAFPQEIWLLWKARTFPTSAAASDAQRIHLALRDDVQGLVILPQGLGRKQPRLNPAGASRCRRSASPRPP